MNAFTAKIAKGIPSYYPALPDPELNEIAGAWGPMHRLDIAEKWEQWIKQLRDSVADLDNWLPKDQNTRWN